MNTKDIMNTNLERFGLDENGETHYVFVFKIFNSDYPDLCQLSPGYPL